MNKFSLALFASSKERERERVGEFSLFTARLTVANAPGLSVSFVGLVYVSFWNLFSVTCSNIVFCLHLIKILFYRPQSGEMTQTHKGNSSNCSLFITLGLPTSTSRISSCGQFCVVPVLHVITKQNFA